MEKPIYCPVNGWDCEYWRKGGLCVCDVPEEDCEDYVWFEDCFKDIND